MDNHGSPWRISRPQTNQSYVGKFRGYEHAFPPSISNQIGTSRIPMNKSIVVEGSKLCFNLSGSTFKSETLEFHMFSLFLPSNTSFGLALLLVPIELLSYIFKPISLGVRLFANLMAGHTLLKVIVGFS